MEFNTFYVFAPVGARSDAYKAHVLEFHSMVTPNNNLLIPPWNLTPFACFPPADALGLVSPVGRPHPWLAEQLSKGTIHPTYECIEQSSPLWYLWTTIPPEILTAYSAS
jgi:hypothetical protein